MILWRIAFAALVSISLCDGATAADNKKLIVGKWEVTKADPNTLPVGSKVEFAADGKIKITIKADKEISADGIYTLDGDSFTFKIQAGSKEETKKITIRKLDEKELDTIDNKNKSVILKRLK